MFVYSLRASTLKMIGVVCVALTLMITLIVFVPTYSLEETPTAATTVTYSYDKVKNASDVSAFLSQFGWETEAEPGETKTVTVPAEFDKTFAAYNELQKKQGLDLSKYAGKEVVKYTFVLKNYPDYDGKVLANVLVYRSRVIGGDVCSATATGGFIHGFEK